LERFAMPEKFVVVDYLYLDLQTCDRCIGTGDVLDAVMETLTPALEIAGYGVCYNKTLVETAAQAEDLRFEASPTVRVNGRDICLAVAENHCGCCSDISGSDVDCRVFEFEGQAYEVPPHAMLADAVLRGVFGGDTCGCADDAAYGGACDCGADCGEGCCDASDGCCGEFVLSENLRAFFAGKKAGGLLRGFGMRLRG
jgi:hypothetical protein